MKSIQQLTRERLVQEALLRGIEDAESLPSRELIVRLLRASGEQALVRAAGAPAVQRAQQMLGAAVEAASLAAPRQVEALRELSRKLPEVVRRLSSRPPRPASWRPEPLPWGEQSPSGPGGQPGEGPVSSGLVISGLGAEALRARETAGEPGEKAGEPGEPAGPAGIGVRRFREKLPRSPGMARILYGQGHRELALAVYRELMAASPHDEGLRQQFQRAARGEPVPVEEAAATAAAPAPVELDPSMPGGTGAIRCQPAGAEALNLSWEVSAAGVERAGQVLREPGELVVRVICVAPDPAQAARTEVWERGPVPSAGAWSVGQLPADCRCFAAVGLRAGDRFVSIAHAAVTR